MQLLFPISVPFLVPILVLDSALVYFPAPILYTCLIPLFPLVGRYLDMDCETFGLRCLPADDPIPYKTILWRTNLRRPKFWRSENMAKLNKNRHISDVTENKGIFYHFVL